MLKKIFILFILLFLVSCSDKSTNGGTIDETDTQISLVGYVKDRGTQKGIEDLIIRLAKTGFKDTTDEDGFYSINVPKETLSLKGIDLKTLNDSVEVVKDQQVVETIDIGKWVDTLPTVYFTQRNISGKLNPSIDNPKRIEAVLTGYQYSPDTSYTEFFNLYHHKETSAFSGFVYFKDNVLDSFSMYVNVYNSDSIFSGRSIIMGFPHGAGNIEFSEFDPFNAVPVVELKGVDSAFINDTIIYKIDKYDNFEGFITKVEIRKYSDSIWNIIDTSDSIFSVILPDTSDVINVFIKVTDNDGNYSFDTISTVVVDTTQRCIKLEGFVKDKISNKGIEGIITRLAELGFKDTTDKNGYFEINVSEDTLNAKGINIDTLTDKIDVVKDGQIVKTLNIINWVDSLSAILFTQRNISGKLNPSIDNPRRIETVLIGYQYSLDTSYIEHYNLYYHKETSAFSGFVYFKDDVLDSFSMYVNVYNSDSMFSGRSITLGFSNSAGDIEFPEFDPFNAVPTVNLDVPDTVSINDTLECIVTALDFFGGFITKIEIDKGSSGNFVDIGEDSLFYFVTPDSACNYSVIVKVTDNDGNYVQDTVTVIVLEPIITISSNSTWISNDTILLSTSASSNQSIISKWEWDVGNAGIFTETTPDTFIKVFNPDSTFKTIVKVTEENGFYILDTIIVDIFKIYNGMIFIPAKDSSFYMGQEGIHQSSSPVHQVSFTYNLYMDTTEVTQGVYDSVMSWGYTNYSSPSWNSSYGIGYLYPVYYVNWYDAVLFCNAKSKMYGKDTVYSYSSISGVPGNNSLLSDVEVDMNKDGFRLPTEAEWEYSCRAGTTTEYFWGSENVSEYAWYSGNSGNSTHEVAMKKPNGFNLYDMPGNVWEWCTDGQDTYTSDSKTDPVGSLTASARCGRGASLSDELGDLRSATRFSSSMNSIFPNFGFRTVLRVR